MTELKFEEALQKLESLVQKLESGDIQLEDALKIYKEGMELTKFCKQKLDKAEAEIKKLSKSGDNNYQLDLL